MRISAHLYEKQGAKQLIDPQILDAAVSHIKNFQNSENFPVLTLNHLAFASGSPFPFLRDVVNRVVDPYYIFNVAKNRNSADTNFRTISQPKPLLMDTQRWILDNCLSDLSLHPASFAYQQNKSTLDCAKRHCGGSWLVKLDLHDFFGNVRETQVKGSFSGLGYGELVSFELSRLCTRIFSGEKASRKVLEDDFTSNLKKNGGVYPKMPLGRLPQGAPTSGALSNLVFKEIDEIIHESVSPLGWIYSRYSDDLIFSIGNRGSRDASVKLVRKVRNIVRKNGFELHGKKIRISPPGARKIVLGLNVDGHFPVLPKSFWDNLQFNLYAVNKFGISNHVRYSGFESIFGYLRHIEGKIAYAKGVDRKRATNFESQWYRCVPRYDDSIG